MYQQEQQFQQERELPYGYGYQPSLEQEIQFEGVELPRMEPGNEFGHLGGTTRFTAPEAGQYHSPFAASPVQGGSAVAILCYLGLWLTGFLFLLFGVKDRFVRFHAMQSLLFFGGVNILFIVLISIIANVVPFVYGFAIFGLVLTSIVALVGWFVGIIGAFRGRYAKLPFAGDLAERFIHTGSLGQQYPKP